MSRLENHVMLRDAATDVFNLQYALLEKYGLAAIEGFFFSWNTDFLGHCSCEGQIHSSVFAQHLKEESRGFCSVISNNSTRPRKGKQTNKKKRLISQTSDSSSRTESCRSTLK